MSAPVLTTTAGDIVNGALRLLSVLDANQSSTPPDQMQDGLQALNFMIKSWQSQGLHLWTKTEGILFLDAGKENYKLGPTGDEVGNLDDFVNTEMAVAGVISDQTLTLDSTTGMEGADDILPSDPSESTQGWVVINGSIAIVTTSLQVSNGGGFGGEAEFNLPATVIGRKYRFIADFTLGTSVNVSYSIKLVASPFTSLGSVTLTASGTGKFEFTATSTALKIEILNGDNTGTDTTLTDRIEILDETTGDFIGIRLDDNTRQWTKVVEVLSSTQVFNSDGLTGVSAIDRSVFSFPDLIPRPLRLLQVRRETIGGNDEIEATKWSRQQYFAQPDKSSQGQINNWYYTPELTNGRIYIWQTAQDVDQVGKFTYIRPIDVNTSTADNPDFPAEWFSVLKYNLAVELAPEFTIEQNRLDRITLKAAQDLDEALGYDREDSSLYVQPNLSN